MDSHRRSRCPGRELSRYGPFALVVALTLATMTVTAPTAQARGIGSTPGFTSRNPNEGAPRVDGAPARHRLTSASFASALASLHARVPAYSRQTGLACSSCHYQFPQLTPFGRLFKLNGYTLTGIPTVKQPGESAGKESLSLLSIPGVAAMVVPSLTQLNEALPGTQNGTAEFPQQFSIFFAGAMTPHLGAFSQFTYAAPDGTIGIDNVDLRYANKGRLAERELIYGLTLNNNPTVQDPWNTVPAWSFPFMSSETAPSSIASPLIDGGLGQQVVGLGAYTLFDNLLYGEFSVYRSAPQGTALPIDSTATNTAKGVIPYWRVALEHETKATSLMLGTFGFSAHLYPEGVTGPTNRYTDVAIDAQAEFRSGTQAWIGRGTYVHETQHLFTGADNTEEKLSTGRINVSYLPNFRYGATLGYFETSGTQDAQLYPSEPVFGSRTGKPNTSGLIGELDYNPWQNARVGVQYQAYGKFNGSSSAYDVPGGRSAANNNSLYVFLWFAF